jgi:glutamine amidotransferase
MTVLVVDYGMGNLGSVRRALEECGAEVLVSEHPPDLKLANRILLPGVGAFADGMAHLEREGWIHALQKAVLDDKLPILGICLGMQLMMSQGDEGGKSSGLGFFEGSVRRMIPAEGERLPHVGWNEIHPCGETPLLKPLLKDILPGTDFYFVHSYCVEPVDSQVIMAHTPYAGGFPSVIGREHMAGVQFHPEKSSQAGFQILKNFLELSSC